MDVDLDALIRAELKEEPDMRLPERFKRIMANPRGYRNLYPIPSIAQRDKEFQRLFMACEDQRRTAYIAVAALLNHVLRHESLLKGWQSHAEQLRARVSTLELQILAAHLASLKKPQQHPHGSPHGDAWREINDALNELNSELETNQ